MFARKTVRLGLPLLGKSYKHKKLFTWINNEHLNNKKCKLFSKGNICNSKFFISNLNFFHTTTNFNNIVSFNLSDIGEGIREVVVKEWYVREGDKVSQFDNICEVQSDKASVTITSRYDGVIKKLHHSVDGIALVGQPLLDIDTGETNDDENLSVLLKTDVVTPVSSKTEPLKYAQNYNKNLEGVNQGFAIPSVRRIANENKIHLADVKGSGKEGRILKEDILKHMQNQSMPVTEESMVMPTDSTYSKPIRGYTRTMIKTMTKAMEIPHFVYNDELIVSNLVKLRERVKVRADNNGLKITYLPFFIKATSNALTRYPVLNSKIDEKVENLIYNTNHNIGIAMHTAVGLAVPVIKNVQSKGIIEICNEINRLQALGKQGKFSKYDVSDGTFTFSNIGAIGGTYASPIILPPQRAILALGAFKKLPRFDEKGTIVMEHIAYLSGAADHRVVDGATMAHFVNFLKNQIEEPFYLFLDL